MSVNSSRVLNQGIWLGFRNECNKRATGSSQLKTKLLIKIHIYRERGKEIPRIFLGSEFPFFGSRTPSEIAVLPFSIELPLAGEKSIIREGT